MMAITHIQNTAPGPPNIMALAVPVMLPVPTRPPMAMDSAWKGDRPELALLFLKEQLSICLNSRICGNFNAMENSRPQPSEKITRMGPHAKLSRAVINSLTVIISLLHFPLPKRADCALQVENFSQIRYNICTLFGLYKLRDMTCHIAI